MKILNIEDDAIKHVNICRVLNSCGVAEIDWAKTLEEGLSLANTTTYDLFITDMYFPRRSGTGPAELGLEFIEEMKKQKNSTPILVCSSVKYNLHDVLGCLHYSDYSDWIHELISHIKNLKTN